MDPYPLKWGFAVSGNYSWFLSFAQSFPAIDVSILVDELDEAPPRFTWASHHFRDLNKTEEVCIRGAALKALFDGAMLLTRGLDYTPEPLGRLINLDSDQTAHSDVRCDPLSPPFSPEWRRWRHDAGVMSSALNHPVSRLLLLSRYDTTARGMLQFLGVNGVTWISLYALRDFMTSGGWTDNKIADGAERKIGDVRLFRQTANNHAAIGPFARHGEAGWQPPAVPMKLHTAAALVLAAAQAFLNQRGDKVDLKAKAAQQVR